MERGGELREEREKSLAMNMWRERGQSTREEEKKGVSSPFYSQDVACCVEPRRNANTFHWYDSARTL